MSHGPLAGRVHLHWRRTKIVATLGPATSTPAAIRGLLEAGVDVMRLNMSHGDHAGHRALFHHIRAAAKNMGRHVAILMDLCGPKIRTGRFPGGAIELNPGQEVVVDARAEVGREGLIPSQYRLIHKDVRPGQRVLLDDGNLELKVLRVKDHRVHCRVVYGGPLKDHKGINLPDSKVSAPAIPKKDMEDARLAVELGADYVAMSFVRSGQNVLALKRLLARHGASIPIISKIETPEGLENIAGILDASDGIMVARGDLGIELPAESVPLVQQQLIRFARMRHKPVIVATQMLESMITHARPTRAEVGDVANAAFASADAVMLSAESASGKYPLQAVQTMDRIVREVEGYQWKKGAFVGEEAAGEELVTRDAFAHAASTLAQELKLQGIVIPTRGGTTARIISSRRPTAPLVAIAHEEAVCRRLALCWGIVPMFIPKRYDYDSVEVCTAVARKANLTRTGHNVLLVSGFHDNPSLNEPTLKLVRV
ncbi:MAG: pyruvate kinase [Betaproteobacteria bacterium]|nr:pyruvate kinase [Betaproteobacteria bacterium]